MQTQSYQIPSSGRTGLYHTVTVLADGRTDCTCEHSTYRRAFCKHQKMVVIGAIPAQPVGTRAAEIAAANAAATDATEVRRIIGGW